MTESAERHVLSAYVGRELCESCYNMAHDEQRKRDRGGGK